MARPTALVRRPTNDFDRPIVFTHGRSPTVRRPPFDDALRRGEGARKEGAREPTQRIVTADRPMLATRPRRDGSRRKCVEASVAATARAAMTWMTEHSGTVQLTRHRKTSVEKEGPDDVGSPLANYSTTRCKHRV
jgi:hypothetical protein